MDENIKQHIKQYVAQKIAEDLPRIVRSDMTNMTELLAKYRGVRVNAPDDLAQTLDAVLGHLAAAREGLLELSAVAGGYGVPGLMGPGSSAGDNPMPDGTPMSGARANEPQAIEIGTGSPMTLTGALAAARFVSSSAIAKRGLRSGAVTVNGQPVTTDITLSPGETYTIGCGETTAAVRIKS